MDMNWVKFWQDKSKCDRKIDEASLYVVMSNLKPIEEREDALKKLAELYGLKK